MGCPRFVHSAFINLGAKLFSYFGKADEGTGLELVIEPWIEDFWKALPTAVESAKQLNTLSSPEPEEIKQIEVLEQDGSGEIYKAHIVSKTTEASHYKTVFKCELELDRVLTIDDNVKPGTYCLIYPKNHPDLVLEFINLWKWEATEELISDLTNNLDFLHKINDKAISIMNTENKELDLKSTAAWNYYDVVNFLKPKVSISKEIIEYRNRKYLFFNISLYIPKMKPRSYSLSSDCLNTNKIEIWFTLEEHEQSDVFEKGHTIIKKGVCSHYLSRVYEQGIKFDLKIHKTSMFDLSKVNLSSTPLIFVGKITI